MQMLMICYFIFLKDVKAFSGNNWAYAIQIQYTYVNIIGL